MKPLIGITTGEIYNRDQPWSPVTYGQSYTYCDAVVAAGGLPVLIPMTDNRVALRDLYGRLDGILFAGGNDLNPELYGQKPLAQTTDFSDKRDKLEERLMTWAWSDDKPMLCICRGMQLMNVLQGGILYQDIPTQLPNASNHQASSTLEDGEHIAHALRVDEESKLAKLLSVTSLDANTHHHQAIKTVGEGIKAVAWAEDMVIEAIEREGGSFGFGFQCHPESLSRVEPGWDKVFAAFVQAARPKAHRS